MATAPLRIPQHIKEQVEAAAKVIDRTPGQLLEAAWLAYRQSAEFRGSFEAAQEAFRSGNLEELAARLRDRTVERAAEKVALVNRHRRAPATP